MKSGIYKLVFAKDVEYIGKSIDMDRRFVEHAKSLLRNKASERMQAAYKKHGMPEAMVIIECHPDHIDILEAFYINTFKPSLNTMYSCCVSPDEFRVLVEDPKLLLQSTVEHVFTIGSQRRLINALKSEVKELLSEYNMPASVKRQILELEAAKITAEALLRQYKKLPWYKRIFI